MLAYVTRLLAALAALQTGILPETAAVLDTFTTKDLLTAPRPRPAIASPDRQHAITIVDQWDAELDT